MMYARQCKIYFLNLPFLVCFCSDVMMIPYGTFVFAVTLLKLYSQH